MEDVKSLLDKRKELLLDLQAQPIWITGSVVESIKTVKGEKKPINYLSKSVNGKNKITYISNKQLEKFRESSSNYLNVKNILSDIVIINIKLIKAGYKND